VKTNDPVIWGASILVSAVQRYVGGDKLEEGPCASLTQLLDSVVVMPPEPFQDLRNILAALMRRRKLVPPIAKRDYSAVLTKGAGGLEKEALLHAILSPMTWDVLRSKARNFAAAESSSLYQPYRKAMEGT